MQINDVLKQLQEGQRPVVELREGIHDKESYGEPNMRARIIHASGPDRDGVVRVEFDFGEFDEHNRSVESANYYDKSGAPTLTAREAGFYKPVDHMYFEADEPLERHMTFVGADQQALFQKFKDSGATTSYVAWLESQVLAAAK